MLPLEIKRIFVFGILLASYHHSFSQVLAPDTTFSEAQKNAIAIYNTTFIEQLHIFNGKEYHDYPRPFDEGYPYFDRSSWSVGSVTYDGNTYDQVSMLYNLVTDELIILGDNKISKINLLKDRVGTFTLLGHTFLNISADSAQTANLKPGFYDVLSTGEIMLLAKRTKNIQTYTKQTVEMRVFGKDHFYAKRNGVFHDLQSKKDLLSEVSDRKKEVQQFMKQNKLKFRKDPEKTMIKVIEYYNQLTKK